MALSYARAGASCIIVVDLLDSTAVEGELLKAAKEAKRPPPKIIRLQVDVTDVKAVEAAAETIGSMIDKLDILVNNAGILVPYSPIGDSDPEKWWRCWEVNVKGVYLMSRSFLPLVLKSEEKTMIMLSSVSAHSSIPGGSAYESTKFSILKLNDYLMGEYGSQGLLAYAISPGGVMTDMANAFPAQYHHFLTDTPQLVANTLVFLTKERREWLACRYVDSRWDMEQLLAKQDVIVEEDLLKVKMRV